jgi:hypothetical protein
MPAKRVIPFGVTFFIHKITKYFKQPGYQQRFSAKISLAVQIIFAYVLKNLNFSLSP